MQVVNLEDDSRKLQSEMRAYHRKLRVVLSERQGTLVFILQCPLVLG
jgi:hypothetical protein